MISNQSLAFVENGVAKGISKGHRGLLFRDGVMVVVDGDGGEESPTMLALAADAQGAREALELDDGNGNLPVNAIVLSDAGSVARADGSLTYDSNGNIVKHDGLADGDDLAKLFFTQKVHGVTDWTAGENIAGTRKKIGRFYVPAGKCVANQVIRITGQLMWKHDSGSNTPPFFTAVAPESDPPTGVGSAYNDCYGFANVATGDWSYVNPLLFWAKLTDEGDDAFSIGNVGQPVTGVINSASLNGILNSVNTLGTGIGTFGVGQWFGIYVISQPTASAPATHVLYDLTVEFE